MFFSAADDIHGQELWKSNGTNAGTVLVKDITPGDYGSYPSSLTAVGGRLFFSANDGVHGQELWKSNGSRSGTVLVRNIKPRDYSRLSHLPDRGGRTLFFTAEDGLHGRELWKSNGSKSGTVLVKDIHPCSTQYRALHADSRQEGGCSSPPTTAPTVGAVEVERHQFGHRPGQGHQHDRSP